MGAHGILHSFPLTTLGVMYVCFIVKVKTIQYKGVESCPQTDSLWRDRATNFSCSQRGGKDVYHCINVFPLENPVEACMARHLVNPSKRDGCPTLYIERGKMNVYFTSCPHNKTGCPQVNDTHYYTDQLWKYPLCFHKELQRSVQRQDHSTEEIRSSIPKSRSQTKSTETVKLTAYVSPVKSQDSRLSKGPNGQQTNRGSKDTLTVILAVVGGVCLTFLVIGVTCTVKKLRNKRSGTDSIKTENDVEINDGLI